MWEVEGPEKLQRGRIMCEPQGTRIYNGDDKVEESEKVNVREPGFIDYEKYLNI